VANLPFAHRDNLSPDEEKLGIEFYTAGKVDGGRDTLRRIRGELEKIELPEEFKGYLPEGWENAMGEVWRVLGGLEEKYQDPFYVAGLERPDWPKKD
jgi:hypothetical protein